MGRRPRLVVDGLVNHAVNRGNTRRLGVRHQTEAIKGRRGEVKGSRTVHPDGGQETCPRLHVFPESACPAATLWPRVISSTPLPSTHSASRPTFANPSGLLSWRPGCAGCQRSCPN